MQNGDNTNIEMSIATNQTSEINTDINGRVSLPSDAVKRIRAESPLKLREESLGRGKLAQSNTDDRGTKVCQSQKENGHDWKTRMFNSEKKQLIMEKYS
jgi:hypothetical protein